MKKVTIAFDVDGTLISNGALDENTIQANESIRSLLVSLAGMKNARIIVWSGGGELWANQAVSALNIKKYVWKACCKCPETAKLVDLAFDDQQDFDMTPINLIVREK